MVTDRHLDWLMVVLIAICFGLIPLVIALRPPALPFRLAFIVFPMIPAFCLAVVALWYALHRR